MPPTSTILVTGGAGFIGGCFVREVIARGGTRVVNLDKLTYAGCIDSLSKVLDSPEHIFVEGDIGDSDLVARLLREYRPRGILNFAAESHVDRSIDRAADFVQTNVVGTFQLLETVLDHWYTLPENERQKFRFLHVSTDEVYGSLGTEGKFTEQTPYHPNSPYSASKAAADHFVRSFHHTYGLPTLITNCSNNYGPYQFPEKLIPLMILNALEYSPLPVYGDGRQVRDWLHVEDHCRALELVLERGRPGETFNIGGSCEKTNIEVVNSICDLLDRICPDQKRGTRKQLIQFVEDRPGHDRRYAIDPAKISRELGWKPKWDFTSGLEQTVRWYAVHSEWVRNITSGGYRRQRLGLGKKTEDLR